MTGFVQIVKNIDNSKVKEIRSIEALKVTVGQYDGQQATVPSYYDNGPLLGGGDFVWDAENSAENDGVLIISVSGIGSGRWIRKGNGVITPYMFGAYGDGVAYDDDYFELMNSFGGSVFIPKPPVSYKFSRDVVLDNVSVTVDPAASWVQITDNGQLYWKRGNISTSVIHRLADRVFIGDAASKAAGNNAASDVGGAWFMDTENYPGYLGINAQMLNAGGNRYKYVGAVKATEHTGGAIIFGGSVVSDVPDRVNWGGIIELQRHSGMCFGWEIAAKNKGNNTRMTPNTIPQGVYGFWLASGGDNLFGGAATAPSTAAIVVLKNDDQPWNSGIVFQANSLTDGEALALSSVASGGGHSINWYNGLGNRSFIIRSDADDSIGWDLRRSNSGLQLRRAGKTLWNFSENINSVNGFNFYPAATGGAPVVSAIGDDTDIDLRLSGKGAGVIRFGNFNASSDVPVVGSINIKDSLGNIRKLAVIA